MKNDYLYNDKELWDDADLNWYDYGFRNYDPQIGRFTQLDPLTDDYPELTPYQYGSNDPIANIDLDGLEGVKSIFTGVETVGASSGLVSKASQLTEIVIKAPAKVAEKTLSFGAKAGIFFKGVGAGINLATNWINHNINPVYGVFNGINSQFTHQDFLDGTPMTHTQGAVDAILPFVPFGKVGGVVEKSIFRGFERTAVEDATKIKYIGRLDDLKNIPRNQTLLDDLPNKWKHLSKQDAAKYLWRQNSSVIRKAARDGYKFIDKSAFRPNTELAPTLENPFRTVGQTFFGAERNLVNYKGWWK